MSYWIAVSGEINFEKTKALNFELQGFKTRQRRKAERMVSGDKLVWYITKQMVFAGFATITGTYFEDHEPIWEGSKSAAAGKPGEDYPWRVPIKAELMLDRDDWIDVEGIARRMSYVSKWPPEHWRLAFQGNLHEVPEIDFELIKVALLHAQSQAAARLTPGQSSVPHPHRAEGRWDSPKANDHEDVSAGIRDGSSEDDDVSTKGPGFLKR